MQRYDAQAKALSGLLDELDKTRTEYDKEQRRLEEKQKSYQSFFDSEKKRLTAELGSSLGQIDKIVSQFKEVIDKLTKEIPEKEKELADRENHLIEARKKEAEAKAGFDLWRTPVASVDARHGKLNALSDKIIAACKNGELAFGYWLLTTHFRPKGDEDRYADKLTGKPDVVKTDALQANIIGAWNDYAKKTRIAQDLDALVKGSKDALATKKAQLDDAKSKFDARIQAALSIIKPQCKSDGA
ncbi:gas vesicle protein [Bradyrhizobium japonicum]